MGLEGPALTLPGQWALKRTAVRIKLFEEPVTPEDVEQGQVCFACRKEGVRIIRDMRLAGSAEGLP